VRKETDNTIIVSNDDLSMPDLEVKERILEHAVDAFLTRGFSKVTVDEIAADLGLSKKTLYKFYPSKEELLRSSLHSMMRSAGWELERIASSGKPLVEKLSTALVTMGKYVSKIRPEAIADFQRFVPSLWKELEQYREEQIVRRIVRMISDAREEGVFREDVNPEILIYMFMNSVRGIINPAILAKHSFSATDAARTIFGVLFEGALTDEARKEFRMFEHTPEFL